jgi:hypothetical protein
MRNKLIAISAMVVLSSMGVAHAWDDDDDYRPGWGEHHGWGGEEHHGWHGGPTIVLPGAVASEQRYRYPNPYERPLTVYNHRTIYHHRTVYHHVYVRHHKLGHRR